MKKIYQTKFGYPEGNCHAACLASIFEIDIETIPAWSHKSNWYDEFTKWCVENVGLYPISIEIGGYYVPKGYHLINGPSTNGDFWHSVVGKDGETIHDPNPAPALKEAKTYTIFYKKIGEVFQSLAEYKETDQRAPKITESAQAKNAALELIRKLKKEESENG